MSNDTLVKRTKLRRLMTNGGARSTRLAAKASLGDVAEVLGVNKTTVWRWESERRIPRNQDVAVRYFDLLQELMSA